MDHFLAVVKRLRQLTVDLGPFATQRKRQNLLKPSTEYGCILKFLRKTFRKFWFQCARVHRYVEERATFVAFFVFSTGFTRNAGGIAY